MDFFENAVNKAKDVFDVACKKTEEAVSTGKIKLDIATIENKLSKDFERLGMIYYEQIKDSEDLEGAIIGLKSTIDEKKAQISKLKDELKNQ